MKQDEIEEVLRKHKLWLKGEAGGERADLRNEDLSGANLSFAALSGVNLCGADLSSANLIGANLRGACLRYTALRGAKLRIATLADANMTKANLYNADLREANLRGAEMFGSKLLEADPREADLSGANLCDVYMRGAKMRYADMEKVHLTKEQRDSININEHSQAVDQKRLRMVKAIMGDIDNEKIADALDNMDLVVSCRGDFDTIMTQLTDAFVDGDMENFERLVKSYHKLFSSLESYLRDILCQLRSN